MLAQNCVGIGSSEHDFGGYDKIILLTSLVLSDLSKAMHLPNCSRILEIFCTQKSKKVELAWLREQGFDTRLKHNFVSTNIYF